MNILIKPNFIRGWLPTHKFNTCVYVSGMQNTRIMCNNNNNI